MIDGTIGLGVPWEVSQRTVRGELGIGKCSSWSDVSVDDSCWISWSSSWAEAKASSSTGAWTMAETLRESASATELDSPWICRISLVNSEMNARWRAWRGERLSELDCRANVSGLWSVLIWKTRPSRKNWKWRTARYAANSSRSKALYLSSAGFNFLEKNEIGFHWPSMNCSSTAPTAVFEASVVTQVGAKGWGWTSITASDKVCWACSKAFCACWSQEKLSADRTWCSGCRISAQWGTKRW